MATQAAPRRLKVPVVVTQTEERYVIAPVEVGAGGFGKVHVGEDRILQRKIAVKTINPDWNKATEEDKERFRREARTLAQLNHPHIPAIYDVVLLDGKFEIVFQFVEGTTLREIIDSGDLALQDCRIWFSQLASALEHAHEKDIVHRDVKPENMIVSPDRKHCYLVDFGIALSKEEMTRLTGSDNWIGTPGYMSPEQEDGKELDSSDDLFVLGGCLYEALCGHRIQQGDYQPLNTINELIPPVIDSLILKCIAPKPKALNSAAEFRDLLRSAVHGHKQLSDILVNGQLYEIAAAIRDMTPAEFMEMKIGQRLLVLQKCHSIIASENPNLEAARIEFLTTMTGLGIFLEPDQYSRVVKPAIKFGFGYLSADGMPAARGNLRVREALAQAARQVGSDNHHAMVEVLLEWLGGINIEVQKNWFYHSVRQLLNALLANPSCSDSDAPRLAEKLAIVDDLHFGHTHDVDQKYAEELVGR